MGEVKLDISDHADVQATWLEGQPDIPPGVVNTLRTLAAEVRALRADLIWSVDHGASGGYDGNSDPCIWYSVERTDKYDHNRQLETIATDGRYSDWPRAVREARTR